MKKPKLKNYKWKIIPYIIRWHKYWLWRDKIEKKPLKLIDPERLSKRKGDSHQSKNYYKLKKTYRSGELGHFVGDRRVKCWKLVSIGYDASSDAHIPIFYS